MRDFRLGQGGLKVSCAAMSRVVWVLRVKILSTYTSRVASFLHIIVREDNFTRTHPQLILMAARVSKEMLIILLRQILVRLAERLWMLVRKDLESSRY